MFSYPAASLKRRYQVERAVDGRGGFDAANGLEDADFVRADRHLDRLVAAGGDFGRDERTIPDGARPFEDKVFDRQCRRAYRPQVDPDRGRRARRAPAGNRSSAQSHS